MNRCVWVNASLVRTSFLLRRGIDLKKIATGMNGASGAESKAVCTEAGFVKSASFGLGFLSVREQQAGMFALRERRQHVTQEDFEMAVSKVMKSLGARGSFSMRQLSFQMSFQGKIRTRI